MESSSSTAQVRKEQPQHKKGSSGNSGTGTDSEGSGSIRSKTSTVDANNQHQTNPSNAAEIADKGKGEAVFRDLKRPASSEACRDSGAVDMNDMHQDIKEHSGGNARLPERKASHGHLFFGGVRTTAVKQRIPIG